MKYLNFKNNFQYKKTKKVRGLLCKKCNAGLGLLQDNIKLLKRAIKYLEKND